MTTTLDVVSLEKNQNDGRSAKAAAAAELVRLAKEQGRALTGPDGVLKLFMKNVLETASNEELTEHLGHEKNRADPDRGSVNTRNGTRPKTVLTEATSKSRSRFLGIVTGRSSPVANLNGSAHPRDRNRSVGTSSLGSASRSGPRRLVRRAPPFLARTLSLAVGNVLTRTVGEPERQVGLPPRENRCVLVVDLDEPRRRLEVPEGREVNGIPLPRNSRPVGNEPSSVATCHTKPVVSTRSGHLSPKPATQRGPIVRGSDL